MFPEQKDGMCALAVACVIDKETIEAQALDEWLAYHLAMGVERFYVCARGGAHADTLDPHVKCGIVVLCHCTDSVAPHGAFFKSVLDAVRGHVRWLAFLEAGEYLAPTCPKDATLIDVLAPYDDDDDDDTAWAVGVREWRHDGSETPAAAANGAHLDTIFATERGTLVACSVPLIVNPAHTDAIVPERWSGTRGKGGVAAGRLRVVCRCASDSCFAQFTTAPTANEVTSAIAVDGRMAPSVCAFVHLTDADDWPTCRRYLTNLHRAAVDYDLYVIMDRALYGGDGRESLLAQVHAFHWSITRTTQRPIDVLVVGARDCPWRLAIDHVTLGRRRSYASLLNLYVGGDRAQSKHTLDTLLGSPDRVIDCLSLLDESLGELRVGLLRDALKNDIKTPTFWVRFDIAAAASLGSGNDVGHRGEGCDGPFSLLVQSCERAGNAVVGLDVARPVLVPSEQEANEHQEVNDAVTEMAREALYGEDTQAPHPLDICVVAHGANAEPRKEKIKLYTGHATAVHVPRDPFAWSLHDLVPFQAHAKGGHGEGVLAFVADMARYHGTVAECAQQTTNLSWAIAMGLAGVRVRGHGAHLLSVLARPCNERRELERVARLADIACASFAWSAGPMAAYMLRSVSALVINLDGLCPSTVRALLDQASGSVKAHILLHAGDNYNGDGDSSNAMADLVGSFLAKHETQWRAAQCPIAALVLLERTM